MRAYCLLELLLIAGRPSTARLRTFLLEGQAHYFEKQLSESYSIGQKENKIDSKRKREEGGKEKIDASHNLLI